jgi:hypothetical protein
VFKDGDNGGDTNEEVQSLAAPVMKSFIGAGGVVLSF